MHGLFFVQVYVEEYETAMVWFVWVFRGFFCLGFFFSFFNFINKVGGKFNSSANG